MNVHACVNRYFSTKFDEAIIEERERVAGKVAQNEEESFAKSYPGGEDEFDDDQQPGCEEELDDERRFSLHGRVNESCFSEMLEEDEYEDGSSFSFDEEGRGRRSVRRHSSGKKKQQLTLEDEGSQKTPLSEDISDDDQHDNISPAAQSRNMEEQRNIERQRRLSQGHTILNTMPSSPSETDMIVAKLPVLETEFNYNQLYAIHIGSHTPK